jgi:glycyl-radical enzyme activating protein
MTDLRQRTGRIFDVQHFSLHDGPGIRTTIFFQGCPLRCRWCHNPESAGTGTSARPILSFLTDRCSACSVCALACGQGVHEVHDGLHELNRDRCAHCGVCIAACPAGALELVGRTVTAGAVFDQVLKDGVFYRTSGGGLTLSGGEPTLQPDFLESLLLQAQAHGIHRALETCGHTPWHHLEHLRPLVDLFLYDLKETDPARHLAFTGVSNDLILSNLHQLHDSGAQITLRLPIIPGLNDREDHFAAVARLVHDLPHLVGVELMAYHPLGESKRQRFGLPPSGLPHLPVTSAEMITTWLQTLRCFGVEATCNS